MSVVYINMIKTTSSVDEMSIYDISECETTQLASCKYTCTQLTYMPVCLCAYVQFAHTSPFSNNK